MICHCTVCWETNDDVDLAYREVYGLSVLICVDCYEAQKK